MALRPFIRVLVAFTLSTAGAGVVAAARLPPSREIVQRLEAEYSSAKDLQARLTGVVLTADQRFPVDVQARVVIPQDIFRLDFEEPQALADNFMLLSAGKMYNYSFLTNTVLVSDARRANASALGNFDVTSLTRISKLVPLDKVTLGQTVSEKTPSGDAFSFEVLRKPGSDLFYSRAKLTILQDNFRPFRFQAFKPDGSPHVDLTVKEWRYNTGLNAKTLTTLPRGVEVINR